MFRYVDNYARLPLLTMTFPLFPIIIKTWQHWLAWHRCWDRAITLFFITTGKDTKRIAGICYQPAL